MTRYVCLHVYENMHMTMYMEVFISVSKIVKHMHEIFSEFCEKWIVLGFLSSRFKF